MAMPATVFAVVVTSIGCKATRVRCGGERQKSRDHECRSAHGPSPSDRAIFARRRDGIEGLSPRRGAFEQIDADRSASFEKGGVRRSEEHTSELQSLMRISYAVFCLKKKKR